MLNQRTWRTIGAVTLTGCGIMGLYGPNVQYRDSPLAFAVYWTVFLILLFVTLWMVLIDIRYIRLQYRAGRRAIFMETLGDEEFRRSLRGEGGEPGEKSERP